MAKLLSLIFIAATINLAAQEATFYQEASKTDGLSSDWSADELTEDEKTGFITGVKNDEENLYLLFQSKSQGTLQKVLASGMSLTLKTKSKPKINAKIDYPEAAKQGQQRGGLRGGQRGQVAGQGSPEENQKRMIDRMNNMLSTKLEGRFKGFVTANGKLPVEKSETIQVALATEPEGDELKFNYELKIPLNELFGQELDWDRISSSDIAIAFTVKPLSNPANSVGGAGRSRGGGRGGAGGGARRGGAGGAGRGGGRTQQGGTSDMFQSQTLKVSYTAKK